jgi:hypothetical protein
MRFLGDTHKTASFIFSKFNVEMLTFDLEFFRDDYVVHDNLEGSHLKPYDILPAAIQGRILVNDTKVRCGKLINFRPRTLICNSSFFRQETEIDPLPKGIDARNSHDYAIAYRKTQLAPPPRDPLTCRIKNKKVVIKRRDSNHSYHECLFQLDQQPVISHVKDRPLQPVRLPSESGKVFHFLEANGLALRVGRRAFCY